MHGLCRDAHVLKPASPAPSPRPPRDPLSGDNLLARPPVALVVSEHEWSTLSLESVLGPSGYAVLRAFNGRQALERVQTISPDVVFIDSRLPDMDGVQLCRVLRQQSTVSLSAPIILITAEQVTRQHQLGALRSGAWEYIRLPTDAEQLLLRLESYLRAKFDADRAREESLLDQNTGLYSMRGLLRRARELASEASRYGRPLACIVVSPDVDRAEEEISESDAFALVDRMTAVFRATNRLSDAVGRLGPNEFVLLAPETDNEGAKRLAERLRSAVQDINVERAASDGPAIRVRIGCYAVEDFSNASIEPVELLTRATLALRHSQSEPGDGIYFYGRVPQVVN